VTGSLALDYQELDNSLRQHNPAARLSRIQKNGYRFVVKSGQINDGTGMIISSSRGVLYASSGDDFAERARFVALELRDEINTYRKMV
jgi:hypothetical protein